MNKKQLYLIYGVLVLVLGLVGYFLTHAKSALISALVAGLIMMIMGGGFVSVTQGALADDAGLGIQYSYFVGVACFAYLAFYAYSVKGILKKQNIQIGEMAGGH